MRWCGRGDHLSNLDQTLKGVSVEPIIKHRLAAVLCLLVIASCTRHPVDPPLTCRTEAQENLEVCMTSAASGTPFLRNLCTEEFEEQLRACAPP
jgi:hypothetical protein